MTNAEREGDGHSGFGRLPLVQSMRKSNSFSNAARWTKSRHAQIYLALLDLCFPNAVTPSFRLELNQLSPAYSMEEPLFAVHKSPYARSASLDDFLQMNIAEIRTTIHHIMRRRALTAHCPTDNLLGMTTTLDSLLHDDLRHVGYTAVLIERRAENSKPDQLPALFFKRLRDFNRITNEELNISAG
jgi:hypothetical protein